MKYTDEQLSRILSAADNDRLRRWGTMASLEPGTGCLEQTARVCMNVYGNTDEPTNTAAADWFDTAGYRLIGDPDAILSALERKGWA